MKRNFTSPAIALAGVLLTLSVSAQVGNYFAGFNSGAGNTGSYNAFVGYQSGPSANTGWYNSFFGYQTGYLNKGGSYNTFVGSFAGYDNSSGLSNTFVGWAAGSNNTTASANSFFGNLAGYQNSTGANNAFFGSATAYNNSSGANNSFFGSRAGYNNTTASHNTYIGFSAGEKTTGGANNVFVGSLAGFSNTTGQSNVSVGYSSGYALTTGFNNSFLGLQAGASTTTAEGNTMLGTAAGRFNSTGYRNVFVGMSAGQNNTTGGDNTFVGRSSGLNNKTGRGNSLLGFLTNTSSGGNLLNATAIGTRAFVSASNALVLGAIKGVNGATVTAKVGIGTTAPAYLLHVNGVAAKPGGGSWTVASDKNLKQDITPFENGLSTILEMKPVWFRYNGKAGLPTDRQFVGVIAQDMQVLAPYSVGEFIYQDSSGAEERYLDYDPSALTYTLVNAVKELQRQNEQQLEEIKALRDALTEVKALLGKEPLRDLAMSAKLWQNFPNPFTQQTVVPYHVPESSNHAEIIIFTSSGQEVYRMTLIEKGQGEVEISDKHLASGAYVYHLVVDGVSVDSKKMVLDK